MIKYRYSRVGEYAQSILANMEYANNSDIFVLCEVVSEYVKSIFAHMEKKSKENKSTKRIRREIILPNSPYTPMDIN